MKTLLYFSHHFKYYTCNNVFTILKFIHSLRNFLNAYCVQGAVNKHEKSPALRNFIIVKKDND